MESQRQEVSMTMRVPSLCSVFTRRLCMRFGAAA
jgi:hypothetical protein